jgi:hypothetical protein
MDQLLLQHARNQFVAQLFHIELDNQKAVHELLSNLRDKLERRIEDFSKRMVNIQIKDLFSPIEINHYCTFNTSYLCPRQIL